ncbi:hypothetical protein CR513_49746, partial [Mucuna pruriens]
MSESKPVKSLIVPSSKINKDIDGVIIDDTYFKQIVGSLMYMSKPIELYLQAAKIILRKGGEENLLAFTYSNYARDEDLCVLVKFKSSVMDVQETTNCYSFKYRGREQVANLMTKALKLEAFQKLKKKMGMLDLAEIYW